jgi:lipoprotein-releasing system permease protein
MIRMSGGLRFETFVALRYLRAKRKIAVISVITALSVLGIAAGVMSLIVALAVNNGLRKDMQERLLGATAHVNVQRKDGEGIENWRTLLKQLEAKPGVAAAAPALYGTLLASHAQRSSQMILKGVILEDEMRVGNLLASLKEGSLNPLRNAAQSNLTTEDTEDTEGKKLKGKIDESAGATGAESAEGFNNSSSASSVSSVVNSPVVNSPPPVVIGRVMAESLGARVGDVMLLTSPQGHLTPFGMVPRYRNFKLVAVFDSGFYDFDSTWSFTTLEAAQSMMALGDVASVIEFKLNDLYQAPAMAASLAAAAGPDFGSTHWIEQNRALFSAMNLEKRVTVIIISLIVLVAALNILISLIMMVMEKYRDIAVLLSMGARPKQVRRIFQLQGLLIGGAGTLLGLIGGYTLAWLGARYHVLKLDPGVYAISYVPFDIRWIDGVWVAAVALVISYLATLYPARAATSIAPADALRYE